MSDPNLPQQPPAHQAPAPGPAPVSAPAPAQPSPVQPGAQAAPVENPKKLSKFLVISIVLLAGLTIASISLLFIGDFEGKFERVFSTFALFAIFVLFTAFDTRSGQKTAWYPPVALIANAYILGLLLIVIWITPYDPFYLFWEIFWKSLYVIVVIRVVILCCQLLLWSGQRYPAVVTRFAFITSVLAVLSGILFTAPAGVDAFDLEVPDLYWRIATALLILTALGLSITLLMRWAYGSDAREAAARARDERARQFAGAPAVSAVPVIPVGAPPVGALPVAQPVPNAEGLLPWPVFADGSPLPAGPDGQPDFSVLDQQARQTEQNPGAPQVPPLQ